jgi:mono/diheme cytochrome c family protein
MPVAARQAALAPVEGASQAAAPVSAAAHGAELAEENGCTACHAPTKEKLVGPGWDGLYGSTVKLADGSSVVADDAYLTEKILKPEARVVEGYEAGVMPSFAEILDADQIADIVAYIRSLGGN